MSEDVGNFSNRARDFLQSAAFLCESAKHGNDGWLPASGLLLGFACELIAKCRLMRMGIIPDRLRNSPYGHDIMAMWKVHTTLFAEAEAVVDEFKKVPNSNGVDAGFNWPLHFSQLAAGHSSLGNYSLRYHGGERHFADPMAVTVVVQRIWELEAKTTGK